MWSWYKSHVVKISIIFQWENNSPATNHVNVTLQCHTAWQRSNKVMFSTTVISGFTSDKPNTLPWYAANENHGVLMVACGNDEKRCFNILVRQHHVFYLILKAQTKWSYVRLRVTESTSVMRNILLWDYSNTTLSSNATLSLMFSIGFLHVFYCPPMSIHTLYFWMVHIQSHRYCAFLNGPHSKILPCVAFWEATCRHGTTIVCPLWVLASPS